MRGALLAAAIFAIVSIALLSKQPLSADEISDLITTHQAPLARMIAYVPTNSGASPLWYLEQKYALGITGYRLRTTRTLSVLFAIAAVFSIAFLAVELDVRPGWVAAVLFAMFPQILRYSGEARVYSQALFFSLLATIFYVRLAKEPGPWRAAAYGITLLAAVYTQPFSGLVAVAQLLWSLAYREFRTLRFGAAAVALVAAAYLPWYLWSRAEWERGGVRVGFHFALHANTPLMIFREVAGAGYWGSGLLAILCGLALWDRRPFSRAQALLLLLMTVPVAGIIAGDAAGNYFVASRQFMWILPALAVLAANAFERHPRLTTVMAVALLILSIRQSDRFFTAPRANWGATGAFLADQTRQGACVEFAPTSYADFYELLQPGLERAHCPPGSTTPRVVLAISPIANIPQREAAIGARKVDGYTEDSETDVGGSAVVFFHRSQ